MPFIPLVLWIISSFSVGAFLTWLYGALFGKDEILDIPIAALFITIAAFYFLNKSNK